MATNARTYRGRIISISAETVDADQVEADFTALTFTEVGGVGKVGAYGPDTNVVNYDTLADAVQSKAKGITNAGDPEVECARSDADAGQVAMRAAGQPTEYGTYGFKVENQDGSIDYLCGLVMGPVNSGGGVEDFDLDVYTLGLVQLPVHTAAA
jgi:hypothetical protein